MSSKNSRYKFVNYMHISVKENNKGGQYEEQQL